MEEEEEGSGGGYPPGIIPLYVPLGTGPTVPPEPIMCMRWAAGGREPMGTGPRYGKEEDDEEEEEEEEEEETELVGSTIFCTMPPPRLLGCMDGYMGAPRPGLVFMIIPDMLCRPPAAPTAPADID